MRRLVSAYGLYVYSAVLDFRGGLGLAVTPGAGTEEESAGFLLFLHVVLIFSEQKLQRRHREGEEKIIRCVFSCCKVNICRRRCFFFK